MLSKLLKRFVNQKSSATPVSGGNGLLQATADASRCVQCGICVYNCPVGIEVREYARRGENVTDSRCISCGTCIDNCPRGTLKWGPAILIRSDNTLELSPDELPLSLRLQPRDLK
jgi:ferredoxin